MTPPVVGNYRIDATLGTGGMAVVYAATDLRSGRRVALKCLRDDHAEGDIARRQARLLREGQALSMLRHPNVVQVFEVGVADGQPFIAMEVVSGVTLADWLRAGPHPWTAIVSRFIAAGRGLAAAHAVGLVHRDFKPSNVLIGADGRVLVTDFGLARLDEALGDPMSAGPMGAGAMSAPLTGTGAVLGTPRYMAPEQHQGRPVDARADQFGFCVALYEALYGRLPFAPPTSSDLPEDLAWALEVVEGRVVATPVDAAAPPAIGAALMRGLNADPDARAPDLSGLLGTLSTALDTTRRRRTGWRIASASVAGAGVFALAVSVLPASVELCRPNANLSALWTTQDIKTFALRFQRAVGGPAAARWAPFASAVDRRVDGLEIARNQACELPARHARVPLACVSRRVEDLKGVLAYARTAPPLAASASVAFLYSAGRCDGPGAGPWLRWLNGDAPAPPPTSDPNHMEAVALIQLARGELLSAGKWLDSVERLRRDVADRRRLGRTSMNYAALHRARREPLKAKLRYVAAARHFEAAGSDSERADAIHAVARMSLEMGNVTGALSGFERALKIRRRIFGPSGALVARSLQGVAQAQVRLNRIGDARRNLSQALEIAEGRLGHVHPFVASLHHDRGWLEQIDNRHGVSHPHHRRAIRIWKSALGADHPRVADGLFALASAELEGDFVDDAVQRLEDVAVMRDKAAAPARARAEVQVLLARAYVAQKKRSAARRAALAARRILKVAAVDAPALTEVVDYIVDDR